MKILKLSNVTSFQKRIAKDMNIVRIPNKYLSNLN